MSRVTVPKTLSAMQRSMANSPDKGYRSNKNTAGTSISSCLPATAGTIASQGIPCNAACKAAGGCGQCTPSQKEAMAAMRVSMEAMMSRNSDVNGNGQEGEEFPQVTTRRIPAGPILQPLRSLHTQARSHASGAQMQINPSMLYEAASRTVTTQSQTVSTFLEDPKIIEGPVFFAISTISFMVFVCCILGSYQSIQALDDVSNSGLITDCKDPIGPTQPRQWLNESRTSNTPVGI